MTAPGGATEPELISWDEVEAQKDVYEAVTTADGRQALVKAAPGMYPSVRPIQTHHLQISARQSRIKFCNLPARPAICLAAVKLTCSPSTALERIWKIFAVPTTWQVHTAVQHRE